jgi:uncharacterized Zn-binding protein involved in type VI secretion
MPAAADGKGIIRLGDATSHGGHVISASETMKIDGIAVARVGDMATCPKCKGVYKIVEGHEYTMDSGKRVAFHGHKIACGATLISSV